MEILDGFPINISFIDGMKFVKSLEFLDGDILTEYSLGNKIYLHYWCDGDDFYQRFLIFSITECDKNEFLNMEKSLYDVYDNSPDDIVFILDINNNDQLFDKLLILGKYQIPSEYIPSQLHYFEELI